MDKHNNINDTKEKARAAKQAAEAEEAAPPKEGVVLLANVGQSTKQVGPSEQRPTVRGPLIHQQVGSKVQGPSVQGHSGTLGFDLGGRIQLSKPRSLKVVDYKVWEAAQQLATKEVATQYGIEVASREMLSSITMLCTYMCRVHVGQLALVEVIHTKTQSIYDARCAQRMSRARRKCQPFVAA